MQYKKTVDQLLTIKWQRLKTQKELTELMYISLITAVEFSKSLRIAIGLNKENQNLFNMAEGELKTDNLSFADYSKVGDHWEFLLHFLIKSGGIVLDGGIILTDLFSDNLTKNITRRVATEAMVYTEQVEYMYNADRAMSIFSREAELPKIFQNMLEKIPVFGEKDLPEHLLAFKYYLERHIALDSDDGGHQDLVKGFEITDRVDIFYKYRLRLYYGAFPQLGISNQC